MRNQDLIRTVLYSAVDMEPITVFNIPGWAMNRMKNGEHINFAVHEPITLESVIKTNFSEIVAKRVTVWAERFRRNGKQSYIFFTNEEANALLLDSDFLPGQQAHLNHKRREAFIEGMLWAIQGLGS